MKELKVKEWIIDKAQQTARAYHCWISYARRDEDGRPTREDGCVYVWIEEEISETEKAIHVRLATGEMDGSVKGWKVWIPKSQIAA